MDLTFVQPAESFRGEDEEDHALCLKLLDDATRYRGSFGWCERIDETYVGWCIGGVVGLLLFKITPSKPDVDEWIWVVVGDLPNAYIAPAAPRPSEALWDYIFQMKRWVEAANNGGSVENLIPVNVPATPEWAGRLAGRLAYLEEHILPEIP